MPQITVGFQGNRLTAYYPPARPTEQFYQEIVDALGSEDGPQLLAEVLARLFGSMGPDG